MKCKHHWIGDTCSHCGVLWHIWIEHSIYELEKQNDYLIKILENISKMNHKDLINRETTVRHRACLLAEQTLAFIKK